MRRISKQLYLIMGGEGTLRRVEVARNCFAICVGVVDASLNTSGTFIPGRCWGPSGDSSSSRIPSRRGLVSWYSGTAPCPLAICPLRLARKRIRGC